MSRNASGVYTLPESAFVAGTTIQSAPVNNDLSDIATALTQSLATTGVSTMTGPIKAAAGSVTAPSYTFGTATGTGFYLSGTNEISWTAAGVLAATFAATGAVTWVGAQTFSSTVSITGALTLSSALSLTNTFSVVTGTEPAITIRNSDNDALEHELIRYALGSGAGTTASRRLIGSGANDVSEIRDYIGSTNVVKIGSTYFKPMKNVIIDDNSIITITTAGYVDVTEIAAPSDPAANTARLYSRDLSSTTILAYRDSAASETILTPPARAYDEYDTAGFIGTAFPNDDTPPQSGEGTEILSITITLKKSNSRIRLEFNGWGTGGDGGGGGATSTNGWPWAAAMFISTSTDALNATVSGPDLSGGINSPTAISLSYEHAPGSVGPHTYSVRIGPLASGSGASTVLTNGFPISGGARIFGGASKMTLIAEEIYI